MSQSMQRVAEKVLGKSYQWIAEHSFPNGSVVRCLPCGKQRNCTTGEIAIWMEIGFPKCKVCSHSVDLINPWAKQ